MLKSCGFLYQLFSNMDNLDILESNPKFVWVLVTEAFIDLIPENIIQSTD